MLPMSLEGKNAQTDFTIVHPGDYYAFVNCHTGWTITVAPTTDA
jgi:hypothetical protein